MIQLIQW